MNRKEKELSFEEAMAGLGSAVQALNREDTPLDEAIAKYEEGVAYYNRCNEILLEAKQKIQQFDKETGEIKEF
ncbi:MAG: exodeoxyribonuclease VII small subunit [Firmicutes bacterium]|nr:exodeoxyribonuclease VII small subunit [Bacillota bacterium]